MKKNMFFYLFLASAIVSCLLTGCKKKEAVPYEDKGYYVFTGDATATQLVPAGTTSGTGRFYGVYDANSEIFNYNLAWNSLDSLVTTARFYGPAGTGQNGVVTRDIFVSTTTNRRPKTDSLSNAIFGYSRLSETELNDLKNGRWYYTISTLANPNGELRGQVVYQRKF